MSNIFIRCLGNRLFEYFRHLKIYLPGILSSLLESTSSRCTCRLPLPNIPQAITYDDNEFVIQDCGRVQFTTG